MQKSINALQLLKLSGLHDQTQQMYRAFLKIAK